MSRTRELPCIHYVAAHNCDLGKDAEFYGLCQTCPSWSPRKGSKPARIDNRLKKLEDAKKKDTRYE